MSLESDDNFYAGITGDISEGGLFVASDAMPKLGEQLTVKLSLPGGVHELHGVVRWVRDPSVCRDGVRPGFGLQWSDISSEALVAIANFVTRRETILYDV